MYEVYVESPEFKELVFGLILHQFFWRIFLINVLEYEMKGSYWIQIRSITIAQKGYKKVKFDIQNLRFATLSFFPRWRTFSVLPVKMLVKIVY